MNDFKRSRAWNNRNIAVTMALLGLSPENIISDKKPEKKCLLKDCARTTTHNGGYCCAAHCKKDREKNRCRHCFKMECECSDLDVSSEMGAK